MSNIEIESNYQPSSFRKLAIGAWRSPVDPKVYTKIKCDITHLKPLLDNSKEDISLVHFFAKAMGIIYKQYPNLNTALIGNKCYQRKEVTAFIHTHIRNKNHYDLTGITVKDTDKKSLIDISNEITNEVTAIRQGKNEAINQTNRILNCFPSWSYQFLVRLFDFLMNRLNINLSWLGLPKDPFGSYGISAIGSLGFEEAFVPLFPLSRLNMIMGVGKPFKEWTFENEKPKKHLMVNLCFTLDHRYLDGAHVAKPLRLLKKIIKNPDLYNIRF
tara:strand:- start:59 stop:874 length:816 start_codon:yes stop_codon:yes gene_type:complete